MCKVIDKKTLEVRAIENGTVIDHIPSDNLYKVIRLLNLEGVMNTVTFGNNLDSKTMGKKAIIKISDMEVDKVMLNSLALLAPEASVNYIKNYEVAEKVMIHLPDTIIGTVKCANPICVTNVEKVTTKFSVNQGSPIHLTCHYCEKITKESEFETLFLL
ncbi:MAG: aspartate carbamoyltransferase regulatory subunit [Rikenellaceae bacterium]